MRQLIDCAVLQLAAHDTWMPALFDDAQALMHRISLHPLDWERQAKLTEPTENLVTDSNVHLGTNCFKQAAVNLRRYDVCLIPVSVATLAWTRLSLASVARGPFTPLFGIFNGLKSAAMQDLLDLGIADFVRLPLCPDEFRARLLTVAARMPRAVSLREESAQWLNYPRTVKDSVIGAKTVNQGALRVPYLSTDASRGRSGVSTFNVLQSLPGRMTKNRLFNHESFRNAKNLVITEFEREYITNALTKHNGNIALAARNADKHRRAFWALMRKYEITADDYRIQA
jgi:hypothetical protein